MYNRIRNRIVGGSENRCLVDGFTDKSIKEREEWPRNAKRLE